MDANSYQPVDFPGRDRLIAAIDAAIAQPDGHALTAALCEAMTRLIRGQEVQLPASVYQPVADHYARRELYRSPEHGYSVVAMTWGPGQGTPLHDHAGLWGVEGVWAGNLEITPYELLEQDGERFRFRAGDTIHAGPGSAGSLIPPHEYHMIRNASGKVAVSVHVYQEEMAYCSRFYPLGDGWHLREAAVLSTDQAA